MENQPGLKYTTFYMHFDTDFFENRDIITTIDYSAEVLSKPRRKWYHLLLQYLTFGIYKASIYYKLKLIKDNNSN